MTSNYTKALGYAYIALYFHPLLTLKAPTDAIFLLKDDMYHIHQPHFYSQKDIS